jgi:hypothetical protein
MIDKWLHLEELGGDHWILPIWCSVEEAERNGKIKKLPKEVYESGLHISIRLNILPRIVARLNADVNELYSVTVKHEKGNVFTNKQEGTTFRISNDLKYNIISDIDSLLFEIHSVCELISTLFHRLYSHVGKTLAMDYVGLKIKSIIESAKQDSSWFSALAGHRNFFIHEGAPYIAVDISGGNGNYELLIPKENIKTFEDKRKFITISEINKIVQGFIESKPIIQSDLINLFKAI